MADLHGGCGMAEFNTEDFQEEEVWAMMKSRQGPISKSKTRKNSSSFSSSASAWRYAGTSRTIPRSTSSGGGTPPHQSSAPVNIPDWSKIIKEKPKKNLWDDACDDAHDGAERKYGHGYMNGHDDDDDGDDDDDDMLPPHEYLARRLASSQIASYSMCEGIGRTLKGRDLSKLRNAILTKTGFLE